jgi:hypothetical protein
LQATTTEAVVKAAKYEKNTAAQACTVTWPRGPMQTSAHSAWTDVVMSKRNGERFAAADTLLVAFDRAVENLVRDSFVAAGLHQHHRGEWRRQGAQRVKSQGR